MKMTLGTILPTRAILDAGDRAADAQAARDKQAGIRRFGFAPAWVHDENRWMLGNGLYATVYNGTARVFETRNDGDYIIEMVKL